MGHEDEGPADQRRQLLHLLVRQPLPGLHHLARRYAGHRDLVVPQDGLNEGRGLQKA